MSSPYNPSAPPIPAPSTTLAKTLSQTTTNTDHLKYAIRELDKSQEDYTEAECYYEGKKPEAFSHNRIARALKNTKDKYKLNFAKTPVNVVADRLAISSVTVRTDEEETDPETTQPDNDLTKTFEKNVWRKCRLERLIEDLHRKVSVFGDSYLFVWTDTEETINEDTGEPEEVSNNVPVMYYNSPKTTRMIYDPEAPDKPIFAIKRWKHFNGLYRINLYYPDRTEHYQLNKDVKPDAPEAADPKNWEELSTPTPNPYERIPIFHFRNGLPYGKPEHVDGYGPQDAINKISTTLVHSTEYMGFPQRFALAEANAALDGNTPGSDWDDEQDATAPEDTDQDEMQSGPGTILKLDGMKEVGTFNSGDPASFLNPAEFYIRSLAQTTTTPLRYFYPPGAHPPSGESYRAEDTPLINKVKQRQKAYTDPYADAFAFAMEIVTDTSADDFLIDIKWAPPASIDDALGWDTVKKKIEAGVPRRQALIEAGYTADQVDRWLDDNDDKAELQRDIESFSLFAAAAKNLADTASANGVNPEAVGLVLTAWLEKFNEAGTKLPAWEEKKPPPTPPPFDSNGRLTQPPHLDTPPGGIPDRRTLPPLPQPL